MRYEGTIEELEELLSGAHSIKDGRLLKAIIGRLETMDATLQEVQTNVAALQAQSAAEHEEFIAFKAGYAEKMATLQAQVDADLAKIAELQAQLAAGGLVTQEQLNALNESVLATSAAIAAIVETETPPA